MNKVDNQDYVQLQMLNQKLQELDVTINEAQMQIEHALIATQTLEALDLTTADQELLVPLGAGTFIEVKAKDVKKVKSIVGTNIVVDKSNKEALVTIKSQLQELHRFQEKSVELYHEVVEKINKLQEDIEKKFKEGV